MNNLFACIYRFAFSLPYPFHLPLTLFVCSVFIFSACNHNTEVKEKTPLDLKSALGVDPISSIDTVINGREYVFCLVNKKGNELAGKFYAGPEISYYKLVKTEDGWKTEMQKSVLTDEFSYLQFYQDPEMVTINAQNYLYFIYRLSPMGNATNYEELDFALYSLSDFSLSVLHCGGAAVYDKKGTFTCMKVEEETKTNLHPVLLNYLQEKKSHSSFIYKPTAKDSDITDISNYEKKWAMDNPGLSAMMNAKDTLEHILQITYYEESIFPEENGSVIDKIKSNKYIVVALFRNNILGFDIRKNAYFPIWVESCSHGCEKNVNFLNDSTLSITYSEIKDAGTINVNLAKKAYRFH